MRPETLTFEYGAMGAQKSANLLIAAYDYEKTGRGALIAKPLDDDKGKDKVVSRIGLERKADLLISKGMDLEQEVLERRRIIRELNKDINIVLVDEAQFLQPQQIDQLFNIAIAHCIPVIAYGLRTDFRTHGFPGSHRLMETAHVLRETTTMCSDEDGCLEQGMFNARKQDGVFVSEGEQVAIDGKGDTTYVALCGRHYIDHVGPVRAKDEATQEEALSA